MDCYDVYFYCNVNLPDDEIVVSPASQHNTHKVREMDICKWSFFRNIYLTLQAKGFRKRPRANFHTVTYKYTHVDTNTNPYLHPSST